MLQIATLDPLEAKGLIQLNYESLKDLQLSHQTLKSIETYDKPTIGTLDDLKFDTLDF